MRPPRRIIRRSIRRSTISNRPLDQLAAQHRRYGAPRGYAPEVATPASPTMSASSKTGSHVSARLTMVGVAVIALFAILLVRLWSIQVVSGASLNSLAKAVTTRTIELQPPRGNIVARGGQVLATDLSVEEVTISQLSLNQNPFVVGNLAALLQVPASAITTTFAHDQFSPYTPIPVPTGPKGVTSGDVLYIEHHAQEFPGVTVQSGYVRQYPYNDLAAQMLGYVGQIQASELASYKKYGYTNEVSIGQTGLESQYELQLHGRPGVEQVEVDPYGNVVQTVSTTPPKRGNTLVLNMDLGLEQVLSNALAKQIGIVRGGLPGNGTASTPAPWGAAVVLDAQTGAVLAITSYPSFNDNIWAGGISQAQYNQLLTAVGQPLNDYAIGSLQPPGSTFKLTTATAALDTGLINANSLINDPGRFTLGNQSFYDTAESRGAGYLNVTQALTASNDIFFYTLGAWFWEDQKRFGPSAIQRYAMQYGLGENPGIDLPGAIIGQVDSAELRRLQHAQAPVAFPNSSYYGGDNVEMAFGQGETLASPLQIAEAYATFANGGTRYAPQMGSEIVSPTGAVVTRIAPHVLGHVALPQSTYQPMLAGFEGVTQNTSGTAYGAFVGFPFNKWNIGGKTGTATVSANDLSKAATAWFVGFGGPVGKPMRYVVAVEVNQGGYGSEAAAPVARQVYNYLTTHPISSTPTP